MKKVNFIQRFIKRNALLLKLTFPIFIELILQLLVGNVDKIMVRNDISANAINNANSIMDMLTISISVLTTASLILISQYKGAKDKKQENKIYNLSFFFNLVIGLVLSFIIFLFAENFLHALNVKEELIHEAKIYLQITGGFIFIQAMILTLSSFLKSNEMVKQTLLVSTVFNIVNILGNYLFLNVFHVKGATGVAIASVLSRSIGCILLFIMYYRKIRIKFSLKSLFPFPSNILKKLLCIGLPSAGESFSYSLSQIVILGFINTLAAYALTTKTYASMLAMISYLFTSAISQGMMIVLGRQLGANEVKEAKQTVWEVLIVSLCTSIFISLLLALLSKPLFSLLTSNQEAIELGLKIMWIDVALEVGRAVNIVCVRAMQTAGDVTYPTTMSIIFCWCVAVLGSYILGIQLKLGLVGIWISMATDELIRAVIFIFRWHLNKWIKKSLIK